MMKSENARPQHCQGCPNWRTHAVASGWCDALKASAERAVPACKIYKTKPGVK